MGFFPMWGASRATHSCLKRSVGKQTGQSKTRENIMATETVDVLEQLEAFFNWIAGDSAAAQQAAQDAGGALAAHGINPEDLVGVNVGQVASQCVADSGLPEAKQQAFQSYSGGGGHPAAPSYPTVAPSNVTQVQQSIQQIATTYVTEIHDESVHTTIFGDNYGDVVSNTGDDSNVAGGDQNVAEGDGSQVIDGDNFGTAQANSGDGAVQAGDDAKGVNTGINTGTIAGDDAVVGDDNQVLDIDGDVGQGTVFGDNSGLAGGVNVDTGGGAGGDASGTGGSGGFGGTGGSSTGDGPFGTGGAGGSAAGGAGTGGNASGGAGGDVDLDINFGSGSETTVENSTLDDSAVGSGGDTSNVSEDTDVNAVDSTVATEQGPGDQAVTLPPPPEEPAEPVREPLHEEPVL